MKPQTQNKRIRLSVEFDAARRDQFICLLGYFTGKAFDLSKDAGLFWHSISEEYLKQLRGDDTAATK